MMERTDEPLKPAFIGPVRSSYLRNYTKFKCFITFLSRIAIMLDVVVRFTALSFFLHLTKFLL